MHASAEINDLAQSLHHALEHAEASDQALREYFFALAEAPTLREPDLDGATELRTARWQACTELGVSVLAWLRAGGELVLEDPRTEALPVGRAPAEAGGETHKEASVPAAVPLEADAPTQERATDADVERPPPPPQRLEEDATTDDEPTDEAPCSPPVRGVDIAALQARFRDGAGFGGDAAVVVQTSVPTALVQRIGAPTPVETPERWQREVDRLEGEVRARRGWSETTSSAHHELVSYIVARARYLQDEVQDRWGFPDPGGRLRGVFRVLSAHQSDCQRGYVNGLGKHQKPSAGTWWAESQIWWRKLAARAGLATEQSRASLLAGVRSALSSPMHPPAVLDALDRAVQHGVASDDPELVSLIEPFAYLLDGTGRLKTLRSVLKQRAGTSESSSAEDPPDAATSVPAEVVDWTRGKTAVFVGGDRSNPALDQALESLELTSMQRESGKQIRRVESIATRVRSGGVDLVVFFREFLSHKVSEVLIPVCRTSESVSVVWVEGGYGAGSLVRALKVAVGRAE